jgi:predicted Fe-Mo cluster-binding NifX family protein
MKVAIAHWQGRISPVFDVADRLFLLDVEDGREIRRESLRLTSRNPFNRVKELSELGVDVLLCGAVSLTLEEALIGSGIRVIGFLGGELENLIGVFLHGELDDGRAWHSARIGKRSTLKSEKLKRLRAQFPGFRR